MHIRCQVGLFRALVYATLYDLFHFSSPYSFLIFLSVYFHLIPLLFKGWANLYFTSLFLYISYYTSSDM